MAYGLQAFKEDGSLLFDTENICYGLLKSGPLTAVDYWPRRVLKSADLPPSSESSWRDLDPPRSLISGITVFDSISPIAFIAGEGVRVGDWVNGNQRTLLFWGATPQTKVYIFDLMRHLGGDTGMQCFDPSGTLTFTTDMPPLNIIQRIESPPLDDIIPGTENQNYPNQQYNAYRGGVNEYVVDAFDNSAGAHLKGSIYMPTVHSGEVAALLTFTRAGGVMWSWRYNPGGFPAAGPGSLLGTTEGIGGMPNGHVKFFMTPSPTTTASYFSVNTTLWFDMPRDRAPSALVIRTSDYPYPFR